jgi:hemerythrin
MKSGQGKDVLGKTVNSLIDYAATHFKTEEKYFARFSYPDAENHQKEHAAFTQKVADFKQGFDSKKLTLTVDVMNFLSGWLKTHIMGSDKQYSRFFNEHGLN